MKETTVLHQGIVYMIQGDGSTHGPYLGAPGIDFASLAAKFRDERYAEAEKAEEDFCWVGEDQFVAWLLAQEFLRPMQSTQVTVSIDTQESRYLPKHWPICPSCDLGRGEEMMGRVLHSLNRADWHRKCTHCGHDWDHRDEPYLFDQPMQEDDGRHIESGCVPYSISQAGELPMEDVLRVCAKHGWRENHGMFDSDGLAAANELGLQLVPIQSRMIAGKRTLRRELASLPPSKNYIVSTNNHWLAVVRGKSRDPAETNLRTEVQFCWEVKAR